VFKGVCLMMNEQFASP